MYDALAPHYRAYADKRAAYLNGVDRVIRLEMPQRASSLLDVGAGDGVRAHQIARACGITTLVLAEPSAAMAEQCRTLSGVQVWQVTAQELPNSDMRFDLITCLWNVLGHLPDAEARVQALSRMRDLLAKDGILFFDVNNRYNASSYGWVEVVKRLWHDWLHPDNNAGDVNALWEIDGRRIPFKGHVFRPQEIKGLLKRARLDIKEHYVIDYTTGEVKSFWMQGQLLFVVTR